MIFVGGLILMRGDVQLARSMTALAADGMAGEDRRLILVQRAIDVKRGVRVTEKALGQDRPVEVRVVHLVTRREVPTVFGEPGQRRHEQVAVAVDQVAAAGAARPHRVSRLELDRQRRIAAGVIRFSLWNCRPSSRRTS